MTIDTEGGVKGGHIRYLTLANFQTHDVVVTALSTLCSAACFFFVFLLQNSLCLRDFRVFVNLLRLYVCTPAVLYVCVCRRWGLNCGSTGALVPPLLHSYSVW